MAPTEEGMVEYDHPVEHPDTAVHETAEWVVKWRGFFCHADITPRKEIRPPEWDEGEEETLDRAVCEEFRVE